MKRIGVLTTHRANNFGSMLQAYSLWRYLSSLPEVDCRIVDYVPPNSDLGSYLPFVSLKDGLRNVLVMLQKKRYDNWTQSMQQFVADDMRITTTTYTDDSLAGLGEDFDHLVCGSDQIWNPELRDASLSFFAPQVRGVSKVSYAPSMGSGAFSDSETIKVREALDDFDHISVRDIRTKNIISKLTDKEVSLVVDPTLLNPPESYLQLANPPLYDDDYIFLFSVKYDKAAVQAAKNASRSMGLPVRVMITGRKSLYSDLLYGFQIAPGSSPADFLSLVNGAKIILSNSFHGTAFSIIFERPFFVVQTMNETTDPRLESLLAACGLSDRVISPQQKHVPQSDPDYGRAEKVRVNSVASAKSFIETALS